mmetsp:Transcript_18875/g.36473  ORF Transcript_18875/g.36473 Transcript_18875/m.36473 type:complete len:204 (+) Transcript_18875:2650-3261(+)
MNREAALVRLSSEAKTLALASSCTLGRSSFVCKGRFVIGAVSCVCSHSSIAARSYVLPSPTRMTGSLKGSKVIGQMKSSLGLMILNRSSLNILTTARKVADVRSMALSLSRIGASVFKVATGSTRMGRLTSRRKVYTNSSFSHRACIATSLVAKAPPVCSCLASGATLASRAPALPCASSCEAKVRMPSMTGRTSSNMIIQFI